MKTAGDINRMKLDLVQSILSLQDMAKLQRLKLVMEADEPTPKAILDCIDRGRAESKAGRGRPIEEFLQEIKDL
jgi:hypothetical protein